MAPVEKNSRGLYDQKGKLMTNMNMIIDSVKKNLKDTNIDIIFASGEYDHIVGPGPTPQPGELMKVIVSDDEDNTLRVAVIDEDRNVYRRIGSWYKDQLPHNDWMLGTLKGFEPKEQIEIMRLMDAWCD